VNVRRAIAYVAAALLALAGAGAAGAIAIVATPAAETTPTVTLSGLDQEPTFSEALTISGANTNGWKITAWAALPTATGGKTLPALEVTAQPTADTCTGGGCNQPVPTGITWPVTLGTTSGTAAKIYNADVNTGKVNDVIHAIFGVKVPANALPGAYTTTIDVIITNAGP
jgi:hypothetical protein